jgi:hypothetical protein
MPLGAAFLGGAPGLRDAELLESADAPLEDLIHGAIDRRLRTAIREDDRGSSASSRGDEKATADRKRRNEHREDSHLQHGTAHGVLLWFG